MAKKYIYHISDGTHVYIGQSAAASEAHKTFVRMVKHLNIAYGNEDAADNEDLLAMIRRNNLKDLKISIYEEPNYGLDPKVFDTFFQYLTPYGHRTTVKNIKTSNNILSSYTTQQVDELTKLDAAEILHIAYAVRENQKVFNVEMGGQYYGWCMLSQPDTLILAQKFEPAKAVGILDYIDSCLNQLQPRIDAAFGRWLHSAETVNSWKRFARTIKFDKQKLTQKDWKELLYEEISTWFWDTSTQTGAWLDLQKALKEELPVVNNLVLKFKTPSQIQQSLADVLSDSISYRIPRQIAHKTYNSLQEAVNDIFSEATFKSGKDWTLSYAQVLSLVKNSIDTTGWWKQTPVPTYVETDDIVANDVKWVAINTMWNIYKALDKVEIEWGRNIPDTDLAFSQDLGPTLSAKIHDVYRQRQIHSPIVESNWRGFYGPMISYIMNVKNNAAWSTEMAEYSNKFGETKTALFAYRTDETVTSPQEDERYVAHKVKPGRESDWMTRTLAEITLY